MVERAAVRATAEVDGIDIIGSRPIRGRPRGLFADSHSAPCALSLCLGRNTRPATHRALGQPGSPRSSFDLRSPTGSAGEPLGAATRPTGASGRLDLALAWGRWYTRTGQWPPVAFASGSPPGVVVAPSVTLLQGSDAECHPLISPGEKSRVDSSWPRSEAE
jgi:hypothetical protein